MLKYLITAPIDNLKRLGLESQQSLSRIMLKDEVLEWIKIENCEIKIMFRFPIKNSGKRPIASITT